MGLNATIESQQVASNNFQFDPRLRIGQLFDFKIIIKLFKRYDTSIRLFALYNFGKNLLIN